MKKRSKRARNCLPAFLLILALIPVILLGGCKDSSAEQDENVDAGMKLISQTYFLKKAPAELYFGKAAQATDSEQGVTIKYLSSFHDGEAVYIFFDVTDTGAGLFCKGGKGHDFLLDKYDFPEKTGYNDSREYQLISYDEKTKTATFCVEYIGPLQTDNLSFHIYSLTGNQKTIDTELRDVDLFELLRQSAGEFELETEFMGAGTAFGIFDEKTGESRNIEMPEFDEGNGSEVYRLKKDALSIPITDTEGNHAADITNIGWRNGWLHVQVNPDNRIKWDTNFNLKNNKTGELVYSPFNLSFGKAEGEEKPDDYREYVFYVGDMTKENLDCTITFIKAPYHATRLKGDWEIKLSIPDSLLKNLEADKAVPLEDRELLIGRAVISPVNITLFASRKDVPEEQTDRFYNIWSDDINLKIIYRDGKSAAVPKESGRLITNQKGHLFRFIYTAEHFGDISGLEVNGILFPVKEQLDEKTE